MRGSLGAEIVRTLAGVAATRRLGRSIAAVLVPGDLVLLSGALGAGKTQLAAALGAGLGAEGRLTSPTFALVHEHAARRAPLVHADFYRLRGEGLARDVVRLGLRERRAEGAVVVVEWGDDAIAVLGGSPAVAVRLEIAGARERVAFVSGPRVGDIV